MSHILKHVYPPNPNTNRGAGTRIGTQGSKIIYANGKSIVIRDLTNASNVVVYSGHIHPTTAARISPSGFYAASADVQGNVRIWDIASDDNILKGEYRALSGKINDIAWDGESKRIIVVGNGRDKFGHAFQFDTGSSVGEITGHSRVVNAVSIRHQRPFRAATAGDDGQIIFHTGVPFKFEKIIKCHTKFVQDVQFSPSGDFFVSAGSDAKMFGFDGKTGEQLFELSEPHKGTIYSSSWSPDSKSVVSSGADGVVKIWDIETKRSVTSWNLGSSVDQQQVGNTWTQHGQIASLSMNGQLNLFDPRQGSEPHSVLAAPQKAITSVAVSESTFLAGSADGRIHAYTLFSGETTFLDNGHSSLVSSIAASERGTLWSAGFDDRVREISQDGHSFTGTQFGPSASQPQGIASSEHGIVLVAEAGHIEVLKDGQKVSTLAVTWEPTSIAAASNDGLIAVGGKDAKVHLYVRNGSKLSELGTTLDGNKGPVSSLAFSVDGKLLSAGDTSGKIVVFDVMERKAIISRWTFHSGRINSLAFSASGRHVVSGGLDTHVYVWSIDKPMRNTAIKNAGPEGVNGVCWVGANTVASAGADGTIRIWELSVLPGQ